MCVKKTLTTIEIIQKYNWCISEVTICTRCLHLKVLSRFKRFLRCSRSQNIVFLFEKIVNRILQFSSILNENRKQWLWKLINCTLKSILLTKTMKKVLFDSNDYKRLTESISFKNIVIYDKCITSQLLVFKYQFNSKMPGSSLSNI